VLVSCSAGIEDDAERAARRRADEALAEHLESAPFEQFIERWGSQALFAHDPPEVAALARADQRRNRPAALAAALRGVGAGEMRPLWQALAGVRMPAAVVAGDRDRRFARLARRMASALPRAFSAGVDIRDHAGGRLDAMLTEVRENARLLLNLTPLTVAAIHGSTLGGGAELALLCDVVLAADDTTLGFPEITIAAFPPIAAACLPERCGWALAMRLLLGESIDAATAAQSGLVRQVVPADQLAATAARLAAELAANSAVALRALTAATRIQRAPAILQRLDAALATYQEALGSSRDAEEGVSAFLEKRAPVWSHR